MFSNSDKASDGVYYFKDNITGITTNFIDYRVRMINFDGTSKLSRVIRLLFTSLIDEGLTIFPNPVRDRFQMKIFSSTADLAEILVSDMQGRPVMKWEAQINKGENNLIITKNENCPPSTYMTMLKIGRKVFYKKIIILE